MAHKLIIGSDIDGCLIPINIYNLAQIIIDIDDFPPIDEGYWHDWVHGEPSARGPINAYLATHYKNPDSFENKQFWLGLFDVFYQHSPEFKTHFDASKSLFDWAREQGDTVELIFTTTNDKKVSVDALLERFGIGERQATVHLNCTGASKRGKVLYDRMNILQREGHSTAVAYIDDHIDQARGAIKRCAILANKRDSIIDLCFAEGAHGFAANEQNTIYDNQGHNYQGIFDITSCAPNMDVEKLQDTIGSLPLVEPPYRQHVCNAHSMNIFHAVLESRLPRFLGKTDRNVGPSELVEHNYCLSYPAQSGEQQYFDVTGSGSIRHSFV